MQYIFRFFVATQCVALSNVRKKFVAGATGPNANNITLQTTADWRDSTVLLLRAFGTFYLRRRKRNTVFTLYNRLYNRLDELCK